MRDLGSLRRGPLVAPDSDVLQAAPPLARWLLQIRGDAAAAALELALGSPLPRQACRSANLGPIEALWLGPDEWLLLSSSPAAELQSTLSAALSDTAHSLVDVSHRQTAWLVCGDTATQAINAGCPLDLGARAFPVGACTRTVLGKASIVLWHREPSIFHLETGRSFAAYVHAYLQVALHDNAPIPL